MSSNQCYSECLFLCFDSPSTLYIHCTNPDRHFDLNELWTKKREFAAGVFVLIVETMQKQDRYKAIQSLVDHLDAKAKESCDLKQGILDTLSQCVAVAADGSLGE